jgi:hypothetical protein
MYYVTSSAYGKRVVAKAGVDPHRRHRGPCQRDLRRLARFRGAIVTRRSTNGLWFWMGVVAASLHPAPSAVRARPRAVEESDGSGVEVDMRAGGLGTAGVGEALDRLLERGALTRRDHALDGSFEPGVTRRDIVYFRLDPCPTKPIDPRCS